MSAPKEYSIKIVYQTDLGDIRAIRSTGSDIGVEFLNSPSASFQIPTFNRMWQQEIVNPTALDTHAEVLLQLITRFRDIQITSATHSSEFSGELNLVLSRSEDNELLIRDI
jgi:hypothetical protein